MVKQLDFVKLVKKCVQPQLFLYEQLFFTHTDSHRFDVMLDSPLIL